MMMNTAAIKDALLQEWQPYGPVAVHWASQLVRAMVEQDRVLTLHDALAAALEEEAAYMQDDTLPEDLRVHRALFTAYAAQVATIKTLMRQNEQATQRLNQIERRLAAIKKAGVVAAVSPYAENHAVPAAKTAAASASAGEQPRQVTTSGSSETASTSNPPTPEKPQFHQQFTNEETALPAMHSLWGPTALRQTAPAGQLAATPH